MTPRRRKSDRGVRNWINGNGAPYVRMFLAIICAVALSSIQNYFAPHWQQQADNGAKIDKLTDKIEGLSDRISYMGERISNLEGQVDGNTRTLKQHDRKSGD